MIKRYTPSYEYKSADNSPIDIHFLGNWLLNIIFIIGWWAFFSEIGHALTMIVTKGCYCDFSVPAAPCYGVYVVAAEVLVLCVICIPLFVRFYRGFFIERVGLVKKLLILLYSCGIIFLAPYILMTVENVFSNVMPEISLIEFTPWADDNIVRFARSR